MGYPLSFKARNCITYISGSKPKVKKNKQNCTRRLRRQARDQKQKEKKGSGPQPRRLALQNNQQKRTLLPPHRWEYQN